MVLKLWSAMAPCESHFFHWMRISETYYKQKRNFFWSGILIRFVVGSFESYWNGQGFGTFNQLQLRGYLRKGRLQNLGTIRFFTLPMFQRLAVKSRYPSKHCVTFIVFFFLLYKYVLISRVNFTKKITDLGFCKLGSFYVYFFLSTIARKRVTFYSL